MGVCLFNSAREAETGESWSVSPVSKFQASPGYVERSCFRIKMDRQDKVGFYGGIPRRAFWRKGISVGL